MTATADGVGVVSANPHHKKRWLILGVIGIAQLMVVLDATIVNIAMPSAQRALDFSDTDRQWIVTGYSLAFGSLLLLGGRISDLFGRKPTFLAGLIGFAGASALGGAAGSFEVLVAARVLQGAFGALLAPAALSLLTTTFTNAKERATAFGVFGAIAGGGGAIGLLLGGVLTEYASWRWCLYVNLAFAGIAAVGGFLLLRHEKSTIRPKLDLPGTVTGSSGLFALVYGFANAETHGWSAPLTVGCLVGSVFLLALFGWIQTRSANPLLPPRLLADRNRTGSYLAVLIIGVGMFAVFLFLTYYLQLMLGYSPIQTGLAFLPMVAGLMVGAQLATIVLIPRFGPKPLVVAGMLLAAAGMVWLTQIGLDSSFVQTILGPEIVLGLGLGLVIATGMSTATLGVQRADSGVASAMVNTSQQIGGSIGTALLNTLATSAATSYLAGKAMSPEVQAQAMLHSYTTAFWWAAGIFLAGAVVCGLLFRSGVSVQDPAAEPVLIH
jgi:EmrB/QacA subfamily drug resistance transporter